VDLLFGDATRARAKLGWRSKVGSRELVHMMVEAEVARQMLGSCR
jgi:GDP-D-mannose dehydratase